MESPKDIEKYQEHYSEEAFWDKLKKIGKKAGQEVVYNALLLYYTLQSPATPATNKIVILGALGYLILPVDLIPDFIPALGFADDAAALAAAIKTIKDSITPEIKQQARAKSEEWFT